MAPNGQEVPAKRWAVVSRWGTEENGKDPTILAWSVDDPGRAATSHTGALAWNYSVALRRILVEADLNGVVTGLGHGRSREKVAARQSVEEGSAYRTLVIDGFSLGPGLAAAVGPFGPLPLLGTEDLGLADRMRERSQEVAFVSLSGDYIDDSYRDRTLFGDEDVRRFGRSEIGLERASEQAGLTVVWPGRLERVEIDRD